jgi:hypothetical protein
MAYRESFDARRVPHGQGTEPVRATPLAPRFWNSHPLSGARSCAEGLVIESIEIRTALRIASRMGRGGFEPPTSAL